MSSNIFKGSISDAAPLSSDFPLSRPSSVDGSYVFKRFHILVLWIDNSQPNDSKT
jgi:hypothetical protein